MSDEGRSVVQLKTIALFLFLPNLYRYTGFYSYRRPLRVNRRPLRVNRGLLLLIYRCIGFCKWVLEICLTSKNTVSIIINRISPIPKCTVTSSACNFSTITIAPRVICPTTNAAAIIDTIFVDLEVSFDLKVKNMVINNMIPVVEVTVL